MEQYDIIVIGGGFAGLTCALTLAKEGRRVCVLEKEHTLGGAFQSFKRKGTRLDTGFHYVGGVGKGEIMYPLIQYFGLEQLPWVQLDETFLEVHLRGETFQIHCGYDAFIDSLGALFPNDKKSLQKLVEIMKDINAHIYESIVPGSNATQNEYMMISAREYLQTNIESPTLRDILCGQSVTTELSDELPLYAFLQSLNSFIQHSYRLKGGGETLIKQLAKNITDLGGTLLTRHAVTQFRIGEDGQIGGALCDNGKELHAAQYISTLHPAVTMQLIPDCKQVRNIYRKRFMRLKDSKGMFTVQLVLKPNTVPYQNHSIGIFNSDDLWHTDYGKNAPVQNMLINYNVPETDSKFATNIDLLTPMEWDAVSEWSETNIGNRPHDYETFKQQKAQECITIAQKYIPKLTGNIEQIWTSTPLTYRDYTGTRGGSAYGIRKSCVNVLGTLLSPSTPFPNLFLSGQNLILHGMQGVAMTSILTCNIICGKNILQQYQ